MKINSKFRESTQQILIIQTAFIGDVILITPLIRETKIIFPNALLDVMVIPQAANLLDNNPYVNTVIKFDKRKSKLFSFFRTLTLLKNNKYDIAISPHSSFTSALLMLLSGIKYRVGFARWASQNFLTHRLPHLKKTLKIKKNLHLLSIFTDKEFPIQTELFPTQQMYSKADKLLKQLDNSSNKIIAIAPGSNWYTKRWPEEHYKDLVYKLNDSNYGIVFIGSNVEREICENIKPNNNYLNLAGELSLLESAALIKKCDLMICNDSGAMHLANAVNTDVFVFFGPTVQSIGYPPIGKNDHVFEIDLECRPCSSHGTKECPLKHHNCMKFIEAESVFRKVQEKFS
jgi:heptosyltransferase-2